MALLGRRDTDAEATVKRDATEREGRLDATLADARRVMRHSSRIQRVVGGIDMPPDVLADFREADEVLRAHPR